MFPNLEDQLRTGPDSSKDRQNTRLFLALIELSLAPIPYARHIMPSLLRGLVPL